MRNEDKKQVWLEHIRNNEDLADARKMNECLLPLLKSNLMNKSWKEIMLLSVGCEFRADVNKLVDAEINAYGVEPFSRTKMWYLRKNRGRFYHECLQIDISVQILVMHQPSSE